jgi:predicted dehydrogenase
MNLPDGVFYRPRQVQLIAKDEPAVIRIATGAKYSGNAEYTINDRSFDQAIAPYLHGDWEDFDRLFRLNPWRVVYSGGLPQASPVIYSGGEHRGDPKRPNITVVPNLSIKESRGLPRPFTVFGCTMGHYHPGTPLDYRIQEVYEFQTYGLLALDREGGEVELWVAQDRDKVAVPNGCHMTLYNLGDEDNPLITLDFADPNRNPSNKNLVSRCGPILLAYYDDFEVIFTLSRLYINNPDHEAGVRLANLPRDTREREVRIARGARLDLGRLLYEQLTQNPDVIGRFARLGLRIKHASPEAVLDPLPMGTGSRLYFSLPLVEAATLGTEVYRYFFRTPNPTPQEPRPGPPQGRGIAAVETEIAEAKQQLIQLSPLTRALIVVEGSGNWVEQTYRPLFTKKVDQGKTLNVFYADDTRWKPRPTWADPTHPAYNLQSWETYYDKADPNDRTRYEQLRPDVVFIVTPDFTHSAIACWWLGKSPLVFVEKPFDSQLANVDELLRELGRRRGTAILGLDHYQFYALPVHELKPAIEEHLGGALAGVAFYMTEDRPIELDRVRSLQYGLTLDMLPHCPALLTYFGDVGTIDDIRIVEAGQYRPLIAVDRACSRQEEIAGRFRNETYSRVKFTFQDYSGNGYHVPCLAVIGKGLSREVKYLEVIGRSGQAIRIDLNRRPNPDPAPGYPWDSLFFLQGSQASLPPRAQVRTVSDPYHSQRTLRILYDPSDPRCFAQPLERARYERLLDDLLNGTRDAVASMLLLSEAPEIVRALDRMWWAIQAAKPQWIEYPLGRLDAVRPEEDP